MDRMAAASSYSLCAFAMERHPELDWSKTRHVVEEVVTNAAEHAPGPVLVRLNRAPNP